MRGVSLIHRMLSSFLCNEFLLHIPCWLHLHLGSFSYTSHDGFISIWGVSLPHPVLPSLFSGEFLLQIPSWIYFSMGSFSDTTHPFYFFLSLSLSLFFFFNWGVSLTHPVLYPVLASLLCGVFLLHIPCFVFMRGVSVTRPVLS